MKLVKLFDDYLNVAAAQQNMSREEYTAHYLSESERDTLGELNNMTLGQLERIEDYAEMISDRMEAGQQLDSWMFSQITVALDNLNAVHDAMDGEDDIKESKESDALAKEIDKAMIKIDDSMSYKDFAIAVATVLRDEYGQHNYKPFMEELKNNL
jgi:hypothetical protein